MLKRCNLKHNSYLNAESIGRLVKNWWFYFICDEIVMVEWFKYHYSSSFLCLELTRLTQRIKSGQSSNRICFSVSAAWTFLVLLRIGSLHSFFLLFLPIVFKAVFDFRILFILSFRFFFKGSWFNLIFSFWWQLLLGWNVCIFRICVGWLLHLPYLSHVVVVALLLIILVQLRLCPLRLKGVIFIFVFLRMFFPSLLLTLMGVCTLISQFAGTFVVENLPYA